MAATSPNYFTILVGAISVCDIYIYVCIHIFCAKISSRYASFPHFTHIYIHTEDMYISPFRVAPKVLNLPNFLSLVIF
jgi:hypothetical protein